MNLYKLHDADIAALLRDVKFELTRRAAMAKDGEDAGTIIRGNEMAKRAVMVAAAGNHSLTLIGPPGCGKTMLRALAHRLGCVATFEAHPCPCGYLSDPRNACSCTAKRIASWRLKNWPAAEMMVEVMPLPAREMSSTWRGTSEACLRDQISRMGPLASVEETPTNESCLNLLKASVNEMGLSAFDRQTIIGVARTIAALDGKTTIEPAHICEAINYRSLRAEGRL